MPDTTVVVEPDKTSVVDPGVVDIPLDPKDDETNPPECDCGARVIGLGDDTAPIGNDGGDPTGGLCNPVVLSPTEADSDDPLVLFDGILAVKATPVSPVESLRSPTAATTEGLVCASSSTFDGCRLKEGGSCEFEDEDDVEFLEEERGVVEEPSCARGDFLDVPDGVGTAESECKFQSTH